MLVKLNATKRSDLLVKLNATEHSDLGSSHTSNMPFLFCVGSASP